MAQENTNIDLVDSSVGFVCNRGTVNIYGNNIVGETSNRHVDYDLPPEINAFCDRNDQLAKLEHLFFKKNKKKIVISGLPGIGKSELANKFARKCKEEKKIDVFWLNLENDENRLQSFRYIKSIYEKQREKKSLFIFDGALNRQTIWGSEPQAQYEHLLLVTSCTKDWNEDIKSFELQPLNPKSAVHIFKSIVGVCCPEDDLLYQELAGIFNSIPLALHVIAEYFRILKKSVGSQHFKLRENIDRIKKSINNIITRKIPPNAANSYNKSLYEVIKMLLDSLKSGNISDTNLTFNTLYVCAFLHPDRIIFNDLLTMLNNEELSIYQETELRLALYSLDNISLINYKSKNIDTNDTIKILRIIQNTLQHHMNESEKNRRSTCYNKCLEYTVQNELLHISTILQYADENLETFYEFFRKNKLLLSNKSCSVETLTIVENNELLTEELEQDIQTFYSKKTLLQIFLEILVISSCIESLEKLLEDCGETASIKYINDFNLLHYSICHGKLKVMNLLLRYNIDVNKQNENKNSPLHVAAKYWNLNAIDILINIHDVDKTAKNDQNLLAYQLFFARGGDEDDENIDEDVIIKYSELLNCEEDEE